MADVRNDCQQDEFFVKVFGACGASHPPAVFLASMYGNDLFAPSGTIGKQLAYSRRETLRIFLINFRAAFSLALTSTGAHIGIVQTLLLGALECGLFHQQTLAFIMLAGAAPFQDDC